MLCSEMPDELTSQQASVMRSFRASSTFFRMEPWTRRASNMASVMYVSAYVRKIDFSFTSSDLEVDEKVAP